jgi:hypothetical protein
MPTIPGHRGNANQNTLRFYLIPIIIAIIKNTTPTNVGENVGKKEPLYTTGGNVI